MTLNGCKFPQKQQRKSVVDGIRNKKKKKQEV